MSVREKKKNIIKKIDQACVDAIEDIRKNFAHEYALRYGHNYDIPFTEGSKILGTKYWHKHFGKMKLEDALMILGRREKHGRV